jgi:organic radical activating enzyme
MNKYFPIKSETACKLKWGWSTLYLNSGITASCHRSSFSKLTPENFKNFHNTDVKIKARTLMLDGKWPNGGCEYCQGIEQSGGVSDRMLQNSIPGMFPEQQGAVTDPVVLEVYFNNTCNLSCLYCDPGLSSTIDQENNKFGIFDVSGVKLAPLDQKHIQEFEPLFWDWAKNNFSKIERFHFLGGEPLYQKQLDKFLDFVDENPNPNCEFEIITNLMVPFSTLENKVSKIKHIMSQKKLKRFDVTVSIDCWGKQQEYVRYGLELNTWLENFKFLLSQKWIKLNINQTISVLTIKTMPDLIEKLIEWRKVRPIGHYFSVTEPGPSYLRPNIFGRGVFDKDFEHVLHLMPNSTEDEKRAYQYMSGIANEIESSLINKSEINKLFVFLNEKDRRRNTNWRTLFPWLTEFENYVV